MSRWFSGIPEGAGDAGTEREIFEDTSYGRQLGLLIEVLLARLESSPIPPDEAVEAERRLRALYQRIQAIKACRAAAADGGGTPLVELVRQYSEAEIAALLDYLNAGEPRDGSGSGG